MKKRKVNHKRSEAAKRMLKNTTAIINSPLSKARLIKEYIIDLYKLINPRGYRKRNWIKWLDKI